jgi:malate synthase
MTQPFMRAYSRWLIATCHRRGAHAMGGMAAQIPIRNDEAASEQAMRRFRADKEREAADGHDGTWVAHPALVSAAREIFDRYVPGPNQIARRSDDERVDPAELLVVPDGTISDAGVRKNVRVALVYLSSWLDGTGCVAIDHLMEDAATAEISRTQLWHWRHHGVRLHDGRNVDASLLSDVIDAELAKLRSGTTAKDASLLLAARLLRNLVMADRLEEFLTTAPYEHVSQPVCCAR